MTTAQQQQAARNFAAYWKDKGYEKGESQPFWLSLLRDVYGVEHPEQFIQFEEQVHLDHTSFIDGTIPATHVLIEQKGLGKDLNKPIKQSDGALLNPFEQAKRYILELPVSQHPRWVVTCNFNTFYIDFAYRTFRWDSEAKIKAHVHCVIIGFSVAASSTPKKLFDGDRYQVANHINGYLLDGENVFVESRSKPICNVPEIGMGNQPIDNGQYLFEKEDMEAFIKKEPSAAAYFHPWYGAKEFISQKPRYCLWLGECSPAQLKQMPYCLESPRCQRIPRIQYTGIYR